MLIVDYDALSRLSNNASKLAKHAESYAENLTNKVIKRFDDLAGGGSTYTADAKYYVKAKVRKLQEKQAAYENLSSQIVTFSDKARRIDDEVARMLTRNQENFLKNNEHLRVDEWKANLLNFLVDLKNKFPVLEMIGNAIRMTMTELSSMWDNIQYWYQCQGGKEILSFVGAIALAIVSVLIFVASLPASGFFAICAAIGAAIGALNAVTNLVTSFVSMLHALNGDPGWAKVYGDMDNLTDWLRKTNFKNGTLNRLSNGLAFVIDAVELFTAVVGFVEFGKKLITKLRKPNFITNFFSSKTGLWSYCKENVYHEVLDYDEFGNIIGTKWVLKADAYGYVETKFTPKSIWNGMKAFVLDKPVSTSNGQGIRSLLFNNFATDFKIGVKSVFNVQGYKDTFRYTVTDGGRISYSEWKSTFKNPANYFDKIRYNLKYNSVTGMFGKGLKWSDRSYFIQDTAKKLQTTVKYTKVFFSGNLGENLINDIKNSLLSKSDLYNTGKQINGLVGDFKKLGGNYKTMRPMVP